MKIRMIGLMLGAATLAVWGAGCEQPTIDCRATRGSFATTFVLQNGSGTCSEIKTAVIGLQSYYAKGADGQIDLTKSTLAIRPENITYVESDVHALIDEGCADESVISTAEFNSIGSFASVDPDDNAICSVPTSTTTSFVSAEIPPDGDPMDPENACAEGYPAQNITYEWRNIKVHVTTAAPGNRFEADLTLTENGCTANYKVCGVWPLVGCEKYDWLSDTDPACEDEETAPDTCNCPGNAPNTPCAVPTGMPEDKLCDGEPDLEPQYGIPYGSSINTDFKPKCDAESLLCVLPTCPIPPG